MRGEDGTLLAGHVLGSAVVVAHGVLDLQWQPWSVHPSSCQHGHRRPGATYAHVDSHAVTLVSAHGGRDDDQGLLGHKVADASLAVAGARRGGMQVEPEGLGADGQEEKAADVMQQ